MESRFAFMGVPSSRENLKSLTSGSEVIDNFYQLDSTPSYICCTDSLNEQCSSLRLIPVTVTLDSSINLRRFPSILRKTLFFKNSLNPLNFKNIFRRHPCMLFLETTISSYLLNDMAKLPLISNPKFTPNANNSNQVGLVLNIHT